MYIYCKKGSKGFTPPDPSKLVNTLGKYLYEHIDSSEKIEVHSNICDVYINFYYMLPQEVRKMIQRYRADFEEDPNEMKEVLVNINITTYQKKIRVNVIEMLNPSELEHRQASGESIGADRTLGFKVIPPEQCTNFRWFSSIVTEYVISSIKRYYGKYEVLI